MRFNSILFGVCAAACLAVAASAQQQPPAGPQSLQCDAFSKNSEGAWVTKKAMTVFGPNGPQQVAAGVVLSDDMQDRLDVQCSK